MRRLDLQVGYSVMTCALLVSLVALVISITAVPAAAQTDEASASDDATIEDLFRNYMHFALIGRFEVADKLFGDPLIARCDEDPMTEEVAEALIRATESRDDTIGTLLLLINNSSIGENAEKLLKLIEQAHEVKWKDPSRIKANIELLAGDPMQWKVGLERLVESGEYAVPWMLGVLADPGQERLHPFVVRALPHLGRSAINPLLAALDIKDEATLHFVIQALGKIGYPQALPYLEQIIEDDNASANIRASATEALAAIEMKLSDPESGPAAEMFHALAEDYYGSADSLRPDSRLGDLANIWRVRADAKPGEDLVSSIKVPLAIYDVIMCMDCCERSLTLDPDQPEVVALWLAANMRREARLGLDVQSEEPVDARKLDHSRPENWPRSIYFARTAGPRCAQIVLKRAVGDRDRAVALGAVAALNTTAGPAGLTMGNGSDGMSLGEALYFPDLLVRVQAALALGRALPTEPFRGSTEVAPVLASVVRPTDQQSFMVIDADNGLRAMLTQELANRGGRVVDGATLDDALARARKEKLTHLDGVFVASDLKRPTIIEALRGLAADDRFGLAPVVVMVKQGDQLESIVERMEADAGSIGGVFIVPNDQGQVDPAVVEQLLEKREIVATNTGQPTLPSELRVALSMQAISVLTTIAQSHSPVFDATEAQDALISTLKTVEVKELRIGAMWVLSWLKTAEAQRAIAAVAVDSGEAEEMRNFAFVALAESAKRFGSMLDERLGADLSEQAVEEPNMALRTAASRALGALNLPAANAAKIIIGY